MFAIAGVALVAVMAPANALAPEPAPSKGAAPASALRERGPIFEQPVLVDGPMGATGESALDAWEALVPPPELSDFEQALAAAVAATESDGATLAIARHGRVIWTGASGAWTDGSPLSSGQPMVVGSITKTFVAALVLQLVEEGALSLDDTLAARLPGIPIPGTEAITLRQLLDHTSGLADLFNDTTRAALEVAPDVAWTADEILSSLQEPWYQPGENWAYANTNYLLLTMIAERVTGVALEELLASRFLRPLAMDATRLLSPTGEPGSPLSAAWTSIFHGSGSMVSSAADLARWGDVLYTGAVLRDETRREMLDFNSFDQGLGVRRLEVGGVRGFGHTGQLNRYTGLLLHLPQSEVTVALLVSRERAELGAILTHREDGERSLLRLALDLGEP